MSEEMREYLRRLSHCSGRSLSTDLLQAYLKEWGLCQDNLKHHNNWAWQVGAIFIALSLGAFWATSQIADPRENLTMIWILALFSILTMISWGFIIWRARFYLYWTRQRLWDIEKTLRYASNLQYGRDEELLHTMIRDKDKQFGSPPHVKWIPLVFIVVVILIWVGLLLHYGALVLSG